MNYRRAFSRLLAWLEHRLQFKILLLPLGGWRSPIKQIARMARFSLVDVLYILETPQHSVSIKPSASAFELEH